TMRSRRASVLVGRVRWQRHRAQAFGSPPAHDFQTDPVPPNALNPATTDSYPRLTTAGPFCTFQRVTISSPTKGRPVRAISIQQPLPDDEVEETRVARWRFEQFRALGFDAEDAFLLSVSGVDLQAARTLMELGCSHPLALRILL